MSKENEKYDIVEVITKLAESDEMYSLGEVERSEIEAAESALEVKFASDFVEYVQKYGAISIGATELCGVTDDPNCSVVERTKEMREYYANFPKDCYMVEDTGMEGAVHVQFSNGEIYQYWDDDEDELMFVANNLSEFLQKMLNDED